MTIDFTLLDQQFANNIQLLLDNCAKQGYTIVPYYGYRSLESQAKLWRQSRHIDEINTKLGQLKQVGCDYLVEIIESVGPQPMAKWATNAIPGLSWHNWGKAVDCYWLMENGCSNWTGSSPGYKVLGQQAKSLGLRWGGDFSTPDWGHVQAPQEEITKLLTLKEVNDHFESLK